MAGIYGIGVSALKAAQTGIATTSHNIANANTPGFSRQEIIQTAEQPQSIGAGFLGQGANVTTVLRRYDQFLGVQVLEAQTQASTLTTQLGLSQQLSNLLGDTNGGLTPALQDFFNSVNGVSNAPESIPARQAMIGSAQSLVNRLQTLDQRVNQIRDGLNGQISNSVSLINSYAKQIGALNDSIVQLQAKFPGQPPNDLLDQRDQLINQLSQEIRVSKVNQPDGSVDVFIGNGQSLVVGKSVSTLQAVSSATDPTSMDVAYVNSTGVYTIQQSALQGGNLGGFLASRQTVLDPAVNALGRIALGLADTFNQQHQQGTDLKGVLGGSFFISAAPRVTAASSNAGTGALTAAINSTSALTGNDYRVQFDGVNYNVYDTATSALVGGPYTVAAVTAGQAVAGTGITLQLTAGAATAGDSFLVRPTVDGAKNIALNIADPTKIAASSPVRSNAPTTNVGTGAIASASVTGGLPLNANLQNSVTITFIDPTHFTVTDNTLPATLVGAPGTVYNPVTGATLSFNGWTTQISGVPVTGDTFTVSQNTSATADGGNILKLAQLQTANTLVNGTTSYQGAYGQLISQVGSQARELDVTSKAQTSMLNQVTKAAQSVSGVNLDEEAANLMRYQQAYQAAAKAMAIASTMFDALLALGK